MALYEPMTPRLPPWVVERIRTQGITTAVNVLLSEADPFDTEFSHDFGNPLFAQIVQQIMQTPGWLAVAGLKARGTIMQLQCVANS